MNFIDFQKNKTWANIDLTYRCNLGCPQCMRYILEDPKEKNSNARTYLKKKISQSSDISIDNLKKIITFFNKISFCGGISDPIFYKHFEHLLKICESYESKKFKIHTAATQKNIDWYDTAFSNTPRNVTWVMGLDGLSDTSNTYRKRQNSKLMFDAMLLGANKNVNIDWQYIVFPYNAHQVDEAKAIAKENNMNMLLVYSSRDENGKMVKGLEARRERFEFRVDSK